MGGLGEGVTSGDGGDGSAGDWLDGWAGVTLDGYGEGASGGGGGGAGRIRINTIDPILLEGVVTPPGRTSATTFGDLIRVLP